MLDGPISYRDFVDPTEPTYVSDWQILEELSGTSHRSPRELSRGRYRENVVRLQLNDLRRIGLVVEPAHDTFRSTARGEAVARDRSRVPATDGLIDVRAVEPGRFTKSNRLNDFSNLDGETVKRINLDMLADGAEEYGRLEGSRGSTRRRIENVPDTDLHRIMREFPTNDPLARQCAHWLRALSGLHLFPDANHRTAMNSLSVLYETRTGEPLPTGANIERVVLESKLARHLLSNVAFDSLWVRDSLYDVWHRYFRRLLYDDGSLRHEPSNHQLRAVLDYARRRR